MVADGGWFGLFAPAATPPEVVARLHAEVTKSLAEPAVRERLAKIGFGPLGKSSAEFKSFVSEEIKKYAEMARMAGIQPE